ncbi:hypothetical protein ACFQFG_02195 [Methylobacterium persicinum]
MGSTSLNPAFYPALDALASVARACPDLRVAVSGPADPPGAKPAPPPEEAAKPVKSSEKKPAEKKPPAKIAKAEDKKPPEGTEAKPAEDEASGLARQRAQALVEYLLQAGMKPGQVAAGPDRGRGRRRSRWPRDRRRIDPHGGSTPVTLLLAAFWPGLAGAVALGCLVGFLAGWPRDRVVPFGLAGLALLVMALAAAQVVPGLPGLWLEGAALMLPPYLSGCALGALGNRTAGAER